MAGQESDIASVDGTSDFSGGVDSIKVTTIQSDTNPNGLARNQLAWLNNGSVRDGGITTRPGWRFVGRFYGSNGGLYQGGFLYEPDGADPYLVLSIGGRILKLVPDTAAVTDLSALFGLTNPPNVVQSFFKQAEQFLVIQAGDYTGAPTDTLPLFWEGAILRRSIGITTNFPPPNAGPHINEIPAATCMDYFQDRLFYAQNRNVSGGDIVRGTAGTAAYDFRDSVINVTENPLAFGGDGFTVPTNAGAIRSLDHAANLDTSLGQSRLYVGTRKTVYALDVPVTRTDWIAAGTNKMPTMTVIQIVNGPVNDRSVVPVNGDLFFQSLEPAIRSLITAVRYFDQWGNTQISNNEERILQFNDRSLMRFASGWQFDNRLWQAVLPKQVEQGVVHQAVIPLDFTPLSTFETTLPPAFEGMYEGLDIYQGFSGDFGGLERAFAIARNRTTGDYELWEFTHDERFDGNDNRITMYAELPAFNWGDSFKLKRLLTAELWVDRLFGTVDFTMEYRPDGDPCWYPWHQWQMCSSRNTCEDVHNPICYPLTEHQESYRATMTMPRPPAVCASAGSRPSDVGYQFQVRFTAHGFCRLRGMLLYAEPVDKNLYASIVC